MWKTLAALLLKPGKITREYIAGKRLSYTNPFRFLLSLSIVYFLIISFNSEFESLNKYGSSNRIPTFDITKQLNTYEFENEEEKKAAIDSIKLQEFIGDMISKKDSTILSNPKKYFKEIKDDGLFNRYGSKIKFFSTLIKRDTIYSLDESVIKYDITPNLENEMTFNLAKSLVEIEERPGTFSTVSYLNYHLQHFSFYHSFLFSFGWSISEKNTLIPII